ncbi:MAG: HD domain-containing protein [Synergistaceae bacterium]
MLTVEKTYGWFECYAKEFIADEMPKMLVMKKKHSRRVAAISAAIAESMKWSEEHDELTAHCVGLLHDIGRFPQYRDFETFQDSVSIDHGDASAAILEKDFNWDGMPEAFKKTVITAVKYHNKRELPTNIPLGIYKWAALIRDADKIDIFRMVQNRIDNGTIFDMLPRHKITDGLNPALVKEISESGKGSYTNARSLQDYRLIQLTWGCDLNYSVSSVTLRSEGIFERICSDLSKYSIEPLLKDLMSKIEAI